jgi:DtxR family Mn-dependent transcriptional regulator
MISYTEENYLKAIYKILEKGNSSASTNAISSEMNTSAASVTDMLKRLAEKDCIDYKKYKGVTLTEKGENIATTLIRKHRLWEVFLVEKLNFSWDEIHEIAEEMEHIQSEELVNRLDAFLHYPQFDPHGDPIPDAEGHFTFRKQRALTELPLDKSAIVVGVKESSSPFLQYLTQQGLTLGTEIKLLEKFDYDGSVKVLIGNSKELVLSQKVSNNLYVQQS